MIRLVLADMDNTLVPFGQPCASERTMAAIHRCLDEEIVFAPATGRNRHEVAGFLHGDKACYRTAVLANGQQVLCEGELLSEVALDKGALERLEALIRAQSGCALLVYRPDGFCDWVGDEPERLGKFVFDAMHNGSRRHDRLPAYRVVKAGVVALREDAWVRDLHARMAALCPELDFLGTVDCWFDVVPHGCSKARAVGLLCEKLHISRDETCAFGDAVNDIPVFREVVHSCAVANASAEARAAARWHVGASAEDGVAIALEQIADAACLAKETGRDVLPSFAR